MEGNEKEKRRRCLRLTIRCGKRHGRKYPSPWHKMRDRDAARSQCQDRNDSRNRQRDRGRSRSRSKLSTHGQDGRKSASKIARKSSPGSPPLPSRSSPPPQSPAVLCFCFFVLVIFIFYVRPPLCSSRTMRRRPRVTETQRGAGAARGTGAGAARGAGPGGARGAGAGAVPEPELDCFSASSTDGYVATRSFFLHP